MEVTFLKNVQLEKYNTLALKSTAATMAFPHSEKGLVELFTKYNNKKKIIIGRGSNILLSKSFYGDETIFVNFALLNDVKLKDDLIIAQAGAKLSDLVWFSVENNISGFEFLEDIPGTIGGAIIMNAGTYKDFISDIVVNVKYYDVKLEKVLERAVIKEDFSRRQSYWSINNYIVLSCSFKTFKGCPIYSIKEIASIKQNRFKKQPRDFPNAGSVFVRPEKDLKGMVVWELIDSVGLRGKRIGGASFSMKHPGFIINEFGATYEDINQLINLARSLIEDRYGITLYTEWKII